jgi:hypothetical protein
MSQTLTVIMATAVEETGRPVETGRPAVRRGWRS